MKGNNTPYLIEEYIKNNTPSTIFKNEETLTDLSNTTIFKNKETLTDLSNSGLVKMFHDMGILAKGEGIEFLIKVFSEVDNKLGQDLQNIINANNRSKKGRNPSVTKKQVNDSKKSIIKETSTESLGDIPDTISSFEESINLIRNSVSTIVNNIISHNTMNGLEAKLIEATNIVRERERETFVAKHS